MLLAEGRIVQILPSVMPHGYKVGSMWLGAIRERRAAIIARGNSEIELSRAACPEVNEAAAGLAAQALPSGPGQEGASAQALPSGQGLAPALGQGQGLASGQEQAHPRGKAVYWLPEGPKVVS